MNNETAEQFKKLSAKIDSITDAFLAFVKEHCEDKLVTQESENLLCRIDESKRLICDMAGHDFGLDHCGYWQHSYCYRCGDAKYPDLINKRCSELNLNDKEPNT